LPAVAGPHPAGLKPSRLNGPTPPITNDGVTTFTIHNEKCSKVDYGDGRGENDCSNGNVRSALGDGDRRLGEALEYRFDIWVDPSFRYKGFYNDDAAPFRPRAWDSRLRIASWEGQFIKNFIYMLKLDATDGITFMAEVCAPPARFGTWVPFSLKVRWAADERGWVRAECDGKIVYVDEGVATNQPPQCYITNECQPGEVKHPTRFHFVLGPVMAGFGYEWKKYGKPGPFTKFQADGITIKARNVAIERGAVLYGPEDMDVVRQLQERLTALGCNPGAADGVAGKRTREAVMTCRQFEPSKLPKKFNVVTVRKFLELYQSL
jgi:hypothetical protein